MVALRVEALLQNKRAVASTTPGQAGMVGLLGPPLAGAPPRSTARPPDRARRATQDQRILLVGWRRSELGVVLRPGEDHRSEEIRTQPPRFVTFL